MKSTTLKTTLIWGIPNIQRTLASLLYISLVCLLMPQLAWSAYWIDDYSGSSDEYQVIRQGKILTIEAQMLLKAGDELSVLSETGMLRLLKNDHEKEVVLTRETHTFKVPKSESPHSILDNMYALTKQWIMEVPGENVETKALTSRGETSVILSGASDLENQLIFGFNSLVIYWRGGKPPYQLVLLDEDDVVIIEKTDLHDNNIILDDIDIPAGLYGLEVSDGSSSSYIPLAVVEAENAPTLFTKILNSYAPDKVKQSYATVVLASHPEWVFQALQIANNNDLQYLKEKILQGDMPDKIDESLF